MKTSSRFTRQVLITISVLALALMCSWLGAPAVADTDSSEQSADMVVFGGQHQVVKQDQEVKGDLVVIGGSADVFGKVDGDAVAIGGKIYIAPQGRVDGSLVNLGGVIDNQSSTPSGHGAVPPPPTPPSEVPTPPQIEMPTLPSTHIDWLSGWATFYFVDALLAFFAFLLFPARTASATEHLLDNPVLAGILGFFSPIIFVLLVIALAITLVGIPLIPLAVLVTIGGYLIGKAAIAEFIGNRIHDISKSAQPRPVASVAIGLAILFVISALTGWIGIVLYFCIAALAIGTALYMLMRTAETYRSKRPAAAPPPATAGSTNFPVPSASPPTPQAPPAPPAGTSTTPPA